MSIPPLLSSTPPPLEEHESVLDHDDDDNDDDFGEFSNYGAVSSSTSATDSSTTFRPIEMAEQSGGDSLSRSDTNPGPDSLQEVNEWSACDSGAASQPSQASESVHNDSDDLFGNQKLAADGSACDGESVADSSACVSCEGDAGKLPTVSPSSSPVTVSERLNPDDVTSVCCGNVNTEVVCMEENSHCEVQTVHTSDHDLCESVKSASDSADREYESEEMKLPVGEDPVSFSATDDSDLESENVRHSAVQDNDNEDYSGFPMDGDEQVVANDNVSASDENEFVDDYQSFSSVADTDQNDELEETQLSTSRNDDTAFVSSEEQQPSTDVETCAVITSHSTNSEPVGTLFEDLPVSVVKDCTAVEKQEEITSTDQQLLREQPVSSTEGVDDDFDDFEEFVAAPEGPSEHPPAVDTSYQWNAFDNSPAATGDDDDDDDWAAFQDSEPPGSTDSRNENADSNVAHAVQPVVAYSDRPLKVHTHGIFNMLWKFVRCLTDIDFQNG